MILRKYNPKIIAVTGNVGKTTTKNFLYHIYKSTGQKVGYSHANFNSEIGVALSVFLEKESSRSFIKWWWIIQKAKFKILLKYNYPKVLIIEAGIDSPGDMDKIAKNLKPNISIITKLTNAPSHLENFRNLHHQHSEKLKLFEHTRDFVLYNAKDENIKKYLHDIPQHLKQFAFGSNESPVKLVKYELVYENGKLIGSIGQFSIQKNIIPVMLKGVVGRNIFESMLGAITLAHFDGVSDADIVLGLKNVDLEKNRMGVKYADNILIIDDTYNSSPSALTGAINTLKEINVSGEKIAVLGGMNELGSKEYEAHFEAIKQVNSVADKCILIGDKWVKPLEDTPRKNIEFLMFDSSDDVAEIIEQHVSNNDCVLVKGSRGYKTEIVVKKLL